MFSLLTLASSGGMTAFSFRQAEACSVLLCSSVLDLIFQLWTAISTRANLLSGKWLPVSVLGPEKGPFGGRGVKIKDLPESFESMSLQFVNAGTA